MCCCSTASMMTRWSGARPSSLTCLICLSAFYPDFGNPLDIRYALVWKPPAGFFAPFRRLGLVINLGAGVDSLLAAQICRTCRSPGCSTPTWRA